MKFTSGLIRAIFVLPAMGGSLLFFAWIERGGVLPRLGLELGWPWIQGAHWTLAGRLAWDALLFGVFGAIHTAIAQPRFRAPRLLYMVITAVTLLGLMGLWQSSARVLWAAPLGWSARNLLSFVLFWFFMGIAALSIMRLGAAEFVGLKASTPVTLSPSTPDIHSPSTPVLVTTGLFAYVRHPVYFFTLLAIFATPWMTLDRFWIGVCVIVYLWFAVPIEERKLRAEFGVGYDEYRARVPAFFPRFRTAGANRGREP